MLGTIFTAESPSLWIFINVYMSGWGRAPKSFFITASSICTCFILFSSPDEWKYTVFIYYWTVYSFTWILQKEYKVNVELIMIFSIILKLWETILELANYFLSTIRNLQNYLNYLSVCLLLAIYTAAFWCCIERIYTFDPNHMQSCIPRRCFRLSFQCDLSLKVLLLKFLIRPLIQFYKCILDYRLHLEILSNQNKIIHELCFELIII